MHPEIFTPEQCKLLPLLKCFQREFYLVCGTAIALHLGHRKSIDFDMFKPCPFRSRKILNKIEECHFQYNVTHRVSYQLNLTILNVKFTFFEYPYPIESPIDFNKTLRMPDMLTLAAMKAFALGRRSKWKDYVDLYFLIKDYYSVDDIIQKATTIYGQEFSGKLFRSQLAYHKDIDYTEMVEYMDGYEENEEVIKAFLIEKALEW
jgi:hypothetical protein